MANFIFNDVVWPKEIAANVVIKNYLDTLLKTYWPFCQNAKKFINEIKIDLIGCWWEMFLANLMIEKGFVLEKTPPKGPDIKVRLNDGKVLWIEAIAISDGEKPANLIPDELDGFFIDEEPFLLRLTSGIHDKKIKMLGYLKDGIVKKEDFFIIAVNTGKFSFFDLDLHYPAIAKIVFKIGALALEYKVKDGKADGEPIGFHQVRPTINKKNTPISANLFLSPEYSGVSALIYSKNNFWNMPTSDNVITVYNPTALNKLSEDFFDFGKRCFVRKNEVLYQMKENGSWIKSRMVT
jgi:hypothetical protein